MRASRVSRSSEVSRRNWRLTAERGSESMRWRRSRVRWSSDIRGRGKGGREQGTTSE